jgi:hypothetical protein
MVSFLLVLSSLTAVQTEAPDPARVRRLIQLLDDEQLANRQAAEQALVAFGPEVLSLLPEIAQQRSPEVKERLARIKQMLQTKMAEQFGEGTRVTLGGAMSLKDAFAELERQTGNRAYGFENREVDVQVSWQDQLYWEAVDDLLDQAGLTVQPFGRHADGLDVVSRAEDQEPRRKSGVYQGPFRLEPQFVRALRDLQRPSNCGLQVRAAVTWEPRITPISFSLPLSSIKALDDGSRSIAVSRPEARLNFPVEFSVSEVVFDLPLQLPARDATVIASLQGELTAEIPGRVARFEFDNLAAGAPTLKQQAGVSVTLESVGKNEQLQEMRVRARFDDVGDALASHRGWIYKNDVYLLDKDDRRVELAGSEMKSQAKDEFSIAYYFAVDQAINDYRLVYETPAMILRLSIPFELRNIALP